MDGYEAAYPDVFEVYHRAAGDPALRHRGVERAGEVLERIAQAEGRARDLIGEVAGRLYADRLLPDADPAAVLLVGYGTSNAWTTSFRGRAALFVALESLPAAPVDRVLISHELVHVAHLGRLDLERDLRVGTWLFAEGIATALSRRYAAGLPDLAYLGLGAEGEDWPAACERAWPAIVDGLTAALDQPEAAGERFFSGNPSGSGGLPQRCGYYAGDRWCTRLLDRYSAAELLSLDVPRILSEARLFPAVASELPGAL